MNFIFRGGFVVVSSIICFAIADLLQVKTIRWTFYIDDFVNITFWDTAPISVIWIIGFITGAFNEWFRDMP